MEEKFARLHEGGANPFVDSAGYQQYVALKEKAFRDELTKQQRDATAQP